MTSDRQHLHETGQPEGPSPGSGERFGIRLEPGDRHPDPAFLAEPRPGFGDRSLTLGFGPARMRLEGLSAPQVAVLANRFRNFVVADAAEAVVVRLAPAGVPRFLRDPRPGTEEMYRMGRRRDGDRVVFWSYEFAGWLDPGTRAATLLLVEPDGPLFDRGLENFLRVLTAAFVLEEGGFLLHAAAVVRQGQAYVFFGPSGAGKTTVTSLSPRDLVLSDDLTLVVRTGDGYEAAGIPFGLAHHRVPETTGSFPIASFNLLVQSVRVHRETIAPSRALAELAACLPFVMQETGQAMRAMAVLARVVEDVPVSRLEFRKDDLFWNVMQAGH